MRARRPTTSGAIPGYAVREAFGGRRLTERLAPLWNVLTEPIFTDYFTPKAGQVFGSLQREADRIGWWSLPVKGNVRWCVNGEMVVTSRS